MINTSCSTGLCGGCSSCKRKEMNYKKECKHKWELLKINKGYIAEYVVAICKECLEVRKPVI